MYADPGSGLLFLQIIVAAALTVVYRFRRMRLQFSTLPLVGHIAAFSPGRFQQEQKCLQYLYLAARARAFAADPSLGLALLHLPAPHPPGIYQRRTRRFAPTGSSDYLDNMALADATLGELRAAMERSGVWDRTAVLVSADHGWRLYLWRGNRGWTAEEQAACAGQDTSGVPFLLKMPGGRGLSYGEPFDTVVTRELVGRILRGQLREVGQVASFLTSRNHGPAE